MQDWMFRWIHPRHIWPHTCGFNTSHVRLLQSVSNMRLRRSLSIVPNIWGGVLRRLRLWGQRAAGLAGACLNRSSRSWNDWLQNTCHKADLPWLLNPILGKHSLLRAKTRVKYHEREDQRLIYNLDIDTAQIVGTFVLSMLQISHKLADEAVSYRAETIT